MLAAVFAFCVRSESQIEMVRSKHFLVETEDDGGNSEDIIEDVYAIGDDKDDYLTEAVKKTVIRKDEKPTSHDDYIVSGK